MRPYVPSRGDLVWLDFSPQAGHEQAGHRPAIVISPSGYNRFGLAVFCPITRTVRGHPWEVTLPPSSVMSGVVLADQMRSLDWRARNVAFAEAASSDLVGEVLAKIAPLLGLSISRDDD